MRKVVIFHGKISMLDIQIDQWASRNNANILQLHTVQDFSDDRFAIITLLYEVRDENKD